MRARCGRPSRRYVSKRLQWLCAPADTIRSLSPLPRTSTRPASSARSLVPSPVISETRSPPAYSSSRIALIAQRRRLRLRMRRHHRRALQHLRNFGLCHRLRQNLPSLRRFDIQSWIVMDAPIQQQPLVEPPQAAQLPRGAARVNRMCAQVLQKCSHILLRSRHQHTLPGLLETRQTSSDRRRRPHRSVDATPFPPVDMPDSPSEARGCFQRPHGRLSAPNEVTRVILRSYRTSFITASSSLTQSSR